MNPASSVRHTLPSTSRAAYNNVKSAMPLMPTSDETTRLMGIVAKYDMTTPNSHSTKPIIAASALKTLEISFFLAPTLRKIPIRISTEEDLARGHRGTEEF